MSKLKEKFLELYSLATLRDVDVPGIVGNSILIWNSVTSKYEPHNIEKKYYESDAVSSTTSSIFQDKINVTTPSLLGGDYLFHYSSEFGNNKKARDTAVQFLVNGVVRGDLNAAVNVDMDYISFAGVKKVTLPAGTATLQMQYKADIGSTNTANIRDTRIWLERIVGEI